MAGGFAARLGVKSVIRAASAGDNPPSGQSLIYPKSDGWYTRDSTGAEVKIGEVPAGSKVTDLTALAAASIAPTDVIPIVDVSAGQTMKLSMQDLNQYTEPLTSVITSAQALGTGDTYVTGSRVVLPQARMQAGVVYEGLFVVSKTAAGTATPVVTVRTGTAGTTADTSRHAHTLLAQTAAIDVGELLVRATFRVVGASAVVNVWTKFTHDLASTGLANAQRDLQAQTTSAAFDSTTASMGLGISINAGASSAWTVQQGITKLHNLL